MDAPQDAALLDRARGALAGVAVGDAFGAPFEGSRTVDPQELEEVLRGDGHLDVTDDAIMTAGLAHSLLARRGFDGEHLARTFAADHEAEPWRGYGPGPPRIFSMIEDGVPWDEAPRRLHGGEGSFGNGGAMRVAPVALFAHPDPELERTAELARRSASVTHAHPLGQDGAALQACAVAVLLAGTTDPAELLATVRPQLRTDELRERLDRLEASLDEAGPQDVARTLGNGITAQEAVPAALAAALIASGSFEQTLRFALRIGGDTDTIGAMAGALAGARHGRAGIPDAWLERAELTDQLAEVAEDLLEMDVRR